MSDICDYSETHRPLNITYWNNKIHNILNYGNLLEFKSVIQKWHQEMEDGTDWATCWIDATIRQIVKEVSYVAAVCDEGILGDPNVWWKLAAYNEQEDSAFYLVRHTMVNPSLLVKEPSFLFGATLLEQRAHNISKEAMLGLIEKGGNPVSSPWALYNAVLYERLDISALLLEKGWAADGNVTPRFPSTVPLAKAKNENMIQLLLDHGANPSLTFASGESILEYRIGCWEDSSKFSDFYLGCDIIQIAGAGALQACSPIFISRNELLRRYARIQEKVARIQAAFDRNKS